MEVRLSVEVWSSGKKSPWRKERENEDGQRRREGKEERRRETRLTN